MPIYLSGHPASPADGSFLLVLPVWPLLGPHHTSMRYYETLPKDSDSPKSVPKEASVLVQALLHLVPRRPLSQSQGRGVVEHPPRLPALKVPESLTCLGTGQLTGQKRWCLAPPRTRGVVI